MPKKRGRPPKPPSSSSKQTPFSKPNHDSEPLDVSLVQERLLNLEGLDDLSSKQVAVLMKTLDEIKEKLKGKQVVTDDVEVVYETPFDQQEKGDEPEKTDPPKRASIWDSFDITKLRNAGGKLEYHEPLIKEGTAIGYHMYRFNRKLKQVRDALIQLNKDKFSNIDKKELAIKGQLDDAQRRLHADPNNSVFQRQEKDLYMLYRDISQKNFLFLKQKAKQKWIHEGDQNTAFFHKAIKSRCYRNRVMRVTDIHGNLCTSNSDIQQAFLDYYGDLFNGNHKEWKVTSEEMAMGHILSMI
ncbi:hypothetical protein RIF29_30019 [Crotalaria pallida]|uniref:Uncharacterized protein n=1 Tax=Crotalaria pallida TaxID=3830 RepID=A0AAN9EHP9_CROPI